MHDLNNLHCLHWQKKELKQKQNNTKEQNQRTVCTSNLVSYVISFWQVYFFYKKLGFYHLVILIPAFGKNLDF